MGKRRSVERKKHNQEALNDVAAWKMEKRRTSRRKRKRKRKIRSKKINSSTKKYPYEVENTDREKQPKRDSYAAENLIQ